MIRTIIRLLVMAGGVISGGCIVAITLVMTYEVVARYLFNAPTSWALEVISYLLAASASLGLAYTLRTNAHIGVDVLVRMLPSGGQSLIVRLTQLGIAAFSLVLIVYGVQQTNHAFMLGEISLTPLSVKMWVPLSVVPIGGLLLMLQSLENLRYPPTLGDAVSDVVD